jgi:hypothetical protein
VNPARPSSLLDNPLRKAANVETRWTTRPALFDVSSNRRKRGTQTRPKRPDDRQIQAAGQGGQVLQIIARLTGMIDRFAGLLDRFAGLLDCVELGFLHDGILDQLPEPSTLGANPDRRGLPQRPAGLCRSRRRARVGGRRQGSSSSSHRQGTRDNRPGPRALQRPPGRLRPAHAGRQTARHQTRAHPPLPRSRDHCLGHHRAARRPRGHRAADRRHPDTTTCRELKNWSTIDRNYETLRRNMQTLLNDLGVATKATAGSTQFVCRSRPATSSMVPASGATHNIVALSRT